MKPKMKATTRQDELMYAFDFHEFDLEANREGKLFTGQGQKVMKRESSRWRVPLIGGSIVVTIGLCLFTMSLADSGEVICQSTIFIIGSIVAIAYGVKQWLLISSEVDVGRIESVQGITVVDTDSRAKQVVTIGNYKLKAKRDALLRIKHLEPHIVYFLPRSKIIVSVEVVES